VTLAVDERYWRSRYWRFVTEELVQHRVCAVVIGRQANRRLRVSRHNIIDLLLSISLERLGRLISESNNTSLNNASHFTASKSLSPLTLTIRPASCALDVRRLWRHRQSELTPGPVGTVGISARYGVHRSNSYELHCCSMVLCYPLSSTLIVTCLSDLADWAVCLTAQPYN